MERGVPPSLNPFPRPLFLVAGILVCLPVTGCAGPPAVPQNSGAQPSCSMSALDQAWIDRSLQAWRWTLPNVIGTEAEVDAQALLFSANCVLVSRAALGGEANPLWTAVPHHGTIELPDGDRMPAGVTSFTSVEAEGAWFVMSTPSVWRAGGVPGGPLGLETLMVAVLLHEGIHVLQFPTYGARISTMIERCTFPDSFNDNSIQERFQDEQEFAASVGREIELFFAAADAPDDATATALARESRSLMRKRHDRWFVGQDACLREAEDLWLTLEGTGQWVGHEWLLHAEGGGVTAEAAMAGFGRRSRWWSQNLGLALVRTLHRLDGGAWRHEAFGAGGRTVMQMLDAVLPVGGSPGVLQ